MSRIGIFVNSLPLAGAEKQAVLLAKYLNGIHEVWMIVYYPERIDSKNKTILDENHIRIIGLEGNFVRKFIQFLQLLKQKDFRIVFSYLLTTNLVGGIGCKIFNRKRIFIGGVRNAYIDRWKLPIQRFIHNRLSDLTLFNNYRGVTELVNKGFRPHKAEVIPNCIEMSGMPDCIKRNERAVIITVARLVPQKGFFDMLQAIKHLKLTTDNFRYIIIGYGPIENEIREWISQSGLESEVQLVIKPANLEEYYCNADIYLSGSHYEGLSNTIMEAMSFCLPIVATRVGDNDRLVKDGDNGYLVDARDPVSMALRLAALVNDKAERTRMGIAGFNKVKTEYSPERFQQRYLTLIEKLEKSFA